MFEDLNNWILSIEGREEGQRWALIFALISAAAHAAFGAIQNERTSPYHSG